MTPPSIETVMQRLGLQLRARIEERELQFREVAREMGISTHAAWRMANPGRNRPGGKPYIRSENVRHVLAAVAWLGISFDSLLEPVERVVHWGDVEADIRQMASLSKDEADVVIAAARATYKSLLAIRE